MGYLWKKIYCGGISLCSSRLRPILQVVVLFLFTGRGQLEYSDFVRIRCAGKELDISSVAQQRQMLYLYHAEVKVSALINFVVPGFVTVDIYCLAPICHFREIYCQQAQFGAGKIFFQRIFSFTKFETLTTFYKK